MSLTLESVKANGNSANPPQDSDAVADPQASFGASNLNRMVPATIEASDANVNEMPQAGLNRLICDARR